jgi:GNAT superfamily N-acetyltransferase
MLSLPAFEVRSADPADASEIARLSTQLGYPASEQEMASRLAALLAQADRHVFVADHGDGLIGWISVEQRTTLETGDKIEIVGFVVDASARRRGVGLALLQSAEQWAHTRGFAVVMVRSNAARVESHPFYEKHGYARRKTQQVYFKNL